MGGNEKVDVEWDGEWNLVVRGMLSWEMLDRR